MRFKTQSVILMTGIALMPALVIASFIVYESITARALDARVFEVLRGDSANCSSEEKAMRIIGRMPADVDMAVAKPDGRIIWSSIAGLPVDADFDSGVSSFARSPVADKLVIVGIPLPMPAGYKTALMVPHSFLVRSRQVEDYIKGGIAAFTAVLLFAAVMSIVMLRSMTRSVVGLETATRRVAAGEFDLPIAITGTGEIASLAHSLDSLRAHIKENLARRARFIMGISHDLKTPLALIKGYAETLEEAFARDERVASSHLGIIQSKVDQLEDMIDDLIDFERVNTGEWSRGFKSVELGAFLLSFCNRMGTDANLLGRSLEHRIELDYPAPVLMDERLVTRAMENLVNNALRYTAEGGHIALSAKAAGPFYVVSILDDGPGISAEDLPHIFEPFYRGSSSRREQGMGLGLSIVGTIIESHGWGIEARSVEGVHTEFILTIPQEGFPSPFSPPPAPS